MTQIDSVRTNNVMVGMGLHRRRDEPRPPQPEHRVDCRDRLEISPQAKWMDQLRNMPPVRQPMIDRIRADVAAGTYDVEGKLDLALERMIDDAAEI